jgi:hypothetical protein
MTKQPDLFERTDEDPRRVPFRGWTFRAELDERRLESNLARVFYLLLDEQWHSLSELRQKGGTAGDSRARDLRQWFKVESARVKDLPPSEREAFVAYRGGRDVHEGVWVYRFRPGTITRERVDKFYLEARVTREALVRSANLPGFPPVSQAPAEPASRARHAPSTRLPPR